MEFVVITFFGLAISTLVVQYTSRRTNGTTLSYSQSFKVVLIRSGVAVGAGFLIGRLFSVAISKGFLNKDVLIEQPLVVAGIVAFCGLASFLAFQWGYSKISGKQVSLSSALKFAVKEIGYFMLLLAGVFVLSLTLFGIVEVMASNGSELSIRS
ncbi:hypothetical protein ACN08N_26790 (plasmid) [Photobacterium leiognathi subsp. mandapamensis]|uniref:hypothetical protein n=1 Tax=Photobacterium leiognathi TaxID=553611 RepID=UPI003AF3D096